MGAVLAPITASDVGDVAAFLHAELNPRVDTETWARAIRTSWHVEPPNHGFALRSSGRVVGAYVAYYSRRSVAGRTEGFCNLGAWCVAEEHRAAGTRLLTSLLAQPDWHFTDFSPSGNVVELNRRLRFTELDTTTSLLLNVPRPRHGVQVSDDPARLRGSLRGEEAQAYADHRDAGATHHLLLSSGTEHCHVVVRRDTRRGVRAFGSVLHASNREMFRACAGQVGGHLLRRHGIAATLVEHRVVGGAPRHGRVVKVQRPKMFRSPTLAPEQVDYLYSELTCLPW